MEPKSKFKETASDILQTLLLSGTVFFIVWYFLFRPFQVSGSSMYPNFEDREYVLTNLIGMRFQDPERGDVIVFQSPVEKDKDFIKRVMGLPGDTIMLQEGDVYINEKKVNQHNFLSDDVKTFPGAYLQDGQSLTLGPEEYVVMGDNRGNSSDSREWGVIKKSDIIGETMLVYWPPSEARIIKNPLK